MSLLFRLSVIVLFLSATSCACADRDIVYAARYYAPPGSHQTSHFHLYRINPDGTGRTQLTYGESEDGGPLWSPDGRKIAFLRGLATGFAVCVADRGCHRVRQIASFGGFSNVEGLEWLPDGRSIYFILSDDLLGPRLPRALLVVNVLTGRRRNYEDTNDDGVPPDRHWLRVDGYRKSRFLSLVIPKAVPLSRDIAWSAWIDAKHLVGFVVSRALSGPHILRTVATNGRLSVALPLEYPKIPRWAMDRSSGDEDLLPSPHAGSVVWALKGHTDTNVYQSAFFEVHLPDRAMRFLAQGQFLAWSPDGKRFCTAPGRIPDFLGAAAGPQDAPLEIGAPGGKLKTITPSLVWVTGANWRRGTP